MKHLLLVPDRGDSDKLLELTFPFARVPMAHRAADWVPIDGWRPGVPSGWRIGDEPEPEFTIALVLVWDTEIILEGMDRAIRVLNKKDKFFISPYYKYSMEDVLKVANSKWLRCTTLEIA